MLTHTPPRGGGCLSRFVELRIFCGIKRYSGDFAFFRLEKEVLALVRFWKMFYEPKALFMMFVSLWIQCHVTLDLAAEYKSLSSKKSLMCSILKHFLGGGKTAASRRFLCPYNPR